MMATPERAEIKMVTATAVTAATEHRCQAGQNPQLSAKLSALLPPELI